MKRGLVIKNKNANKAVVKRASSLSSLGFWLHCLCLHKTFSDNYGTPFRDKELKGTEHK